MVIYFKVFRFNMSVLNIQIKTKRLTRGHESQTDLGLVCIHGEYLLLNISVYRYVLTINVFAIYNNIMFTQ